MTRSALIRKADLRRIIQTAKEEGAAVRLSSDEKGKPVITVLPDIPDIHNEPGLEEGPTARHGPKEWD